MAKNEHQNESQNENLGYVLGLMGVIAFSLTLPITKFLTPYLSVWDIGFGRSLLAAMGAVVILLVCRSFCSSVRGTFLPSLWLRSCYISIFRVFLLLICGEYHVLSIRASMFFTIR